VPSPRSNVSPSAKMRARSTNDADMPDSRHLIAGVSGLSLDRAAGGGGATAVAARGSRSLAASPRPSMSSLEFDCLLPTTLPSATDFRGRRVLDQELTRALEISQLNLQGQ
jgi:hypothetical protein